MNCSILNNTPFAAQAFPHTDAQGVHSLALVAKGTWELAAGATNLPRLRPAERQRPIHRAGLLRPLGSLARDEFQAQVLQPRAQQPWPICEPEHVPPKPWFDLLLDACAVSPNGRPASSIDVAVDYERQGRQHRLAALRAFSPRIWIKDFGQLKASELGPSLRIPLLRPFAFGGQTLDARGNSLVDEHNPDGMGFYGTAAQAASAPLPWMQALDKPLRYWDDTVAEQALGLGLVPAHHQPRRALQGSFDDAWRQSRAPLLPLDHDPRHRNAAPQSLQLAESPRPGDVLALHHMGTEPLMRFVWPRVALVAQAETAGGTLLPPQELRWDTLAVDTEQADASLVWRALLPLAAQERIAVVHLWAHENAPRSPPPRNEFPHGLLEHTTLIPLPVAHPACRGSHLHRHQRLAVGCLLGRHAKAHAQTRRCSRQPPSRHHRPLS